MDILPYDPGVLPTLPAPSAGERISFRVDGLPPYKDVSHSIRSVTHPRYRSFVALRNAATEIMNGRAWYFGPVKLDLTIHAPSMHPNRGLNDYLGGVMDTLDGSSGFTFTYLPIVFEDDCQVCACATRFVQTDNAFYALEIQFMGNDVVDL
ncbi:hypothetical protein [Rosistilla oblonga]|uniref:hypothetical protein n=1 Tax=Rosistilla oblonga TaxID=2527990 RepID=UPI0011A33F9D|nr:hypothetical protein [Rosistilla oblonga]